MSETEAWCWTIAIAVIASIVVTPCVICMVEIVLFPPKK